MIKSTFKSVVPFLFLTILMVTVVSLIGSSAKRLSPLQIQAKGQYVLNLSVHELIYDSVITEVSHFKNHFAWDSSSSMAGLKHYEVVPYDQLQATYGKMRQYYLGEYFTGIKVYYSMTSSHNLKFYYVPVFAWQDNVDTTHFELSDGIGRLDYVLRSDIFNVFTLDGTDLVDISNDESAVIEAMNNVMNYYSNIKIKHAGSTTYSNFNIATDATSSFFPSQLIDSLYINNNPTDGSSTLNPDIYFYSTSKFPASGGDYKHAVVMAAEKVSAPHEYQSGNFKYQAANFGRLCPTMCKNISVINHTISN